MLFKVGTACPKRSPHAREVSPLVPSPNALLIVSSLLQEDLGTTMQRRIEVEVYLSGGPLGQGRDCQLLRSPLTMEEASRLCEVWVSAGALTARAIYEAQLAGPS